jgi:hypothetical protein
MTRLKIIMISFFLCSSSIFAETCEERQAKSLHIAQSVLSTIEELFDSTIEDKKKDILSKK